MSRCRQVDILLGAALLLAFSPGLYDLARHWLLHPWSRYSALFVLLVAWCSARERDAKPKRLVGAGLIAAGVVLQLLSVLSVMPAIARLALVLAAIGFMLLRGLATPRVAALAVFVVPVPHAFTDALGGGLVTQELFRGASNLLQPLGVAVGYYLDRWLGTEPILLFVFLVLGFATGIRRLLSIQWPSSNGEGTEAQSKPRKRE